MHKWAWFTAITLNYCTPLYLSLNVCNGFNRQKQKKGQDKILKVSFYLCISLTIPEAEKISFITSNT